MSTHPPPAAPTEQLFRALIEAAPDAVVLSRNGFLLYVNAAAVRLLGYDSAEQLVGQPMSVFLDDASLTLMRRRLAQIREHGTALGSREYPAVRRDGTRIVAEITSAFVDFEGGPAVVAFARDVTERALLRGQLAHADRLSALGMLAAGVAHEINNPLAFVRLTAELLGRRLARVEGERDAQESVRELLAGVDRVARIVRDLGVYARADEEPLGAVDLLTVLASAERLVAHELRPRAALRKEFGPLPPVRGAPLRLEQLFVNLLLNAASAIDETRTDGALTLRAYAEGDQVHVEVQDNGSGISAENLPRIFEPFFTTKAAGTGTGLGLSVCRELVVSLGGSLTATSEPGEGTVLRVSLPRSSTDAYPRALAPEVLAAAALPPLRVLVLDDEELLVTMIARTLGPRHQLVGATDPHRGLELLLHDGRFDVVLCDLLMPGLSGMELYARVAKEKPGLERRFVFFTSGPLTERAQSFLDGVPNPSLRKPFTAGELEERLRVVTGYGARA